MKLYALSEMFIFALVKCQRSKMVQDQWQDSPKSNHADPEWCNQLVITTPGGCNWNYTMTSQLMKQGNLEGYMGMAQLWDYLRN
jgi:hypothetical protein